MYPLTRVRLGATVTWQSLGVVALHRRLLFFPVASWIALLGSAFWLGSLAVGEPILPGLVDAGGADGLVRTAEPAVAFLAGAVLTTLFNLALANNAIRYMRDEEPRIRDGLYSGLGRFGKVLVWGLLSSSVVPLVALLEGLDVTGRVTGVLYGGPPSPATFLVLPIVAFERHRFEGLLDRSRELVARVWPDSGGVGLGVDLVLGVAAVVLGAVGAAARQGALPAGTADPATVVALVGLLVVALLRQIAVPVGKAAMYIHAATERTPEPFDELELSAVARRRPTPDGEDASRPPRPPSSGRQ